MLCKNCGRELPIAGQFCPFCGATVEQTGVNDETAVFTSLPEELNGPIDLSAFDAIMKEDHHAGGPSDGVTTGDPLAVTDPRVPRAGQIPPADVPPVRRTTGQSGAQRTGSASRPNSAPRTTYFSEPDPDDRPYRKPSKGKRGAVVAVVVLLVIVVFHQPPAGRKPHDGRQILQPRQLRQGAGVFPESTAGGQGPDYAGRDHSADSGFPDRAGLCRERAVYRGDRVAQAVAEPRDRPVLRHVQRD